jgi:hypothetical protein
MATLLSNIPIVNDFNIDRSWWVYSTDERPCCGGCDPAYAMDNDGFWRCRCGIWEMVQEAPTLLFPEMAKYNGQRGWGDIWYDEEEAPRLAKQTVAERTAERTASDARMAVAMVSEHLRKVESLYCDRSGKLKQEKVVLRRCKWDDSPASNGFPAGCAAHHSGKCPWVHKDQAQLLTQLQTGKPQGQGGVRDFGALLNKPKQSRW